MQAEARRQAAVRVEVPGILAGKPKEEGGRGLQKIFYDPKEKCFQVGDKKYAFRRRLSRLRMFEVNDGRLDRSAWIATDLNNIKLGEAGSMAVRRVAGKKVELADIGLIEENRKLKTPPRTTLPLFLSYLAVHGAEYAYVQPMPEFTLQQRLGAHTNYYEQQGFEKVFG